MKSLILKDLYNISHNGKSMFFMLLVFACIFIPDSESGLVNFIVVCGILCSMMIVTTFSFDKMSDWPRYALIMPVTKQDLVASKFVVLLIFSVIGILSGLLIGSIGMFIVNRAALSFDGIPELLMASLVGFDVALVFGSMSIPLIIKFGAEKGRMLLLISFIVPAAVCFVIFQLFQVLGFTVTDVVATVLLCCSPFFALLWALIMYKISYRIFSKQEL